MQDLYYITDTSGSFYRLLGDQLTATSSMASADVFSYADASRRIGPGKRSKFYNLVPVGACSVGSTVGMASPAVIAGPVVPTSPVVTAGPEPVGAVDPAAPLSPAPTVAPQPIHAAPAPSASHTALSPKAPEIDRDILELGEVDWLEFLSDFSYYVGQIPGYRQYLKENLSEVDQEICDILHYIEFCEVSPKKAEELVALLQDRRDYRREIKDEIVRVDAFQNSIGTRANAIKADTGVKQIENLDSRIYTPRRLDSLFDGCVLRSYEGDGEDEDWTEDEYQDDWISSEPEKTPEDMKEVRVMPTERKETVYDGKQMDWLELAKSQAIFFANIEQHVCNLQLDIQDIDREISTILESIEKGSYNCVQGYQVFRQLKDLRVRRKALSQELQILSAFTDTFNCEEMLDAYEYTVGSIEALGLEDLCETEEAALQTAG